MTNVYFIDRVNVLNDHGLNTYTTQLTQLLSSNSTLNLTVVWLEAQGKEVSKSYINNITHLYIPGSINKIFNNNPAEPSVTQVVVNDISGKENVIVHLNWINHLDLAYHLKKTLDVKILLTCHCLPWRDLIIKDYPTFYRLDKAYIHSKKATIDHPFLVKEMLGYNYVDHLIAVTESARFSLTHLFKIKDKKISVIPNGITHHGFKALTTRQKSALRLKYGFATDDRILLYAGKISVLKGIIDLIKIFDKLANRPHFKNIRLVIAGSGDHTKALGVVKRNWNRITFTGRLDKSTLYDFYALSDIGLIPSFTEQCSYTAIEMMSSGLPVIVSDIDGLKEMVNDECGLRISVNFNKKRPVIKLSDFETKVCSLLNNPELAKRLATNAKTFAHTNFTANRMADQTIALYNKILNDKSVINTSSSSAPNSTEPLVSILLPCYNGGKYLKECINSVFAQTYQNFELIVIDDASTDDSETVIKSIKDKRLVHLKNDTNKGITSCLNKAIKLAKGKYLARIDADDRMISSRLNLQVSFLESNPEYGMVGGQYDIIDTAGVPFNRIYPPLGNEELKLCMLFFNPFAHPAVTMRSDVAKKLLYNPQYKYCEDYELWFRVAEQHKFKNLAHPLLEYRIHEENSSRKYAKVMRENVMNLLSRELNKLSIAHNPEELMLHLVIWSGFGPKYFTSDEKINALATWLDKIFSSAAITKSYDSKRLKRFKRYIIENKCGLNYGSIFS